MKIDGKNAACDERTNGDIDNKEDDSHNDLHQEEKKKMNDKSDQELIFIHDTCFNIKIEIPNTDVFIVPVSSMELVQEIHHLLMDREDTCHRTCFSLQFNGNTLGNFAELKNIEGLTEGSTLKVVEEPYTVREARIHIRHIRDLLKSLDSSDAYNGLECSSLSFSDVIAQGDLFGKKKGLGPGSIDCTPPEYILPNSKERPLCPLMPQANEQKGPVAIKVMTTSGWNPPPGYRKLQGDLLYLYIVTLEDKRFHITSSTRGFFLNQSTDETFDPKPLNPKNTYHSLVDLLNTISPAFKKNFAIIRKCKRPFERVPTPYQVYSWTAPNLEHTLDSIRAEDSFASKLAYEEHLPGQTRDWNGELQGTRELPRKTLPERLLRERAIFKVHSDFVAAATRGAMAVIDGNVVAINPGEETKMQMFIWNNIFFSLGFDVRDHYKELGGDAAAFAAPNNDLHGVKAYSAADIEGLHVLGTVVVDYRSYRIMAQSIIPGILEREQEQSVVYGSVDFGKTVVTHDKYLELLSSAAKTLKIMPHKVLNEKGEEVEICSSIECKGIIGNDGRHYILDLLRTFPPDVNFFQIPLEEYSARVRTLGFPRKHIHELCCLRQELIDCFCEANYMNFIRLAASEQINKTGHMSDSDIKTPKSKEDSHQELPDSNEHMENGSDLDKCLHKQARETDDKEISTKSSIFDGNKSNNEVQTKENNKEKLQENNENDRMKCLIQNCVKINENKDKFIKNEGVLINKSDSNHTITTLSSKIESKDIDRMENKKILNFINKSDIETTKEAFRKAATAVKSFKEYEFDLRFNPDVYSPTVMHVNEGSEEIKQQRQLVREAAEFLLTVQIPSFIRECRENIIAPMDGVTLSEALHNKGINIRYLGVIGTILKSFPELDYLMKVVLTEILTRSAKHIYNNYLQQIEVLHLASAISHFLNCFLSSCTTIPTSSNVTEEVVKINKRRGRKGRHRSNLSRNSYSFKWAELTSQSLWNNLKNEMNSYYGLVINFKSLDEFIEMYEIQKVSILRSFCLKIGLQILLREYAFQSRSKSTFGPADILNVFPVVKHIDPRASDAYNFYATGQAKIQQGCLKEGYELIAEAFNFFNNVYGAMHPEIVQCLRTLARVNYIMGDYDEAMACQQKAVLMSEKVNGIDHPTTITEYSHLALYCFANSQVTIALKLLYRARYLLLLVFGENHPEMALLDSNIGLTLYAIGEFELSLQFLENVLRLNIRFFGSKSLKAAVSYHLVARTQSCMGDFRNALRNEKETYSIYKLRLGVDHEKTKESSECLRHLTQQAVVLQKKMNEMYKGNRTNFLPIQIQPPFMSSVLDMLNIINGMMFVQISSQDIEKFKMDLDMDKKLLLNFNEEESKKLKTGDYGLYENDNLASKKKEPFLQNSDCEQKVETMLRDFVDVDLSDELTRMLEGFQTGLVNGNAKKTKC